MLTRREQAHLEELCRIHDVKAEMDEERYGRLALLVVQRLDPKASPGPKKLWNSERLELFLGMVERQMQLNRLRPVNRDGIEGWHFEDPDQKQSIKRAVAQIKEQYSEVFGAFSDANLIKKVSEARRSRAN